MKVPSSLAAALKALKTARYPEAIFGPNADDLVSVFWGWSKICHEDMVRAAQKPKAHEAFLLLTKLYGEAEAKVACGTYGDLKPSILATFRTKTGAYNVTSILGRTDLVDAGLSATAANRSTELALASVGAITKKAATVEGEIMFSGGADGVVRL